MKEYDNNRQWADKLMPAVKQIVGPLLLVDAPLEIDRKEATDLIVLLARDMRIGVRTRRPGYADRFFYDFTIRYSLRSGEKTEYQKIMDGWGDWLFYGHRNYGARAPIYPWMIVDLHAFRYAMKWKGLGPNAYGAGEMKNKGEDSTLMAFDVNAFNARSILPPILVASFPDPFVRTGTPTRVSSSSPSLAR